MLNQIIKKRLLQPTGSVFNTFTCSAFLNTSSRSFAAQTQKVQEPLTISQLHHMGYENLQKTKVFDYFSIASPVKDGLKNKKQSFRSFEDQINQQFDIKPTEPATFHSKRVGILGYKVGMTHFWNKWGVMVPCTVVQIDRCQVIQVKTKEKDGVDSIQVGCGEERLKNINKPQVGHFLKYNLPPKDDLAEFRVTPENFLPVGYYLGPRHFKIGQFVDVQSLSKGKGYQGVMKRWNFSGQGASHGNSVSHRHPGSIGNREYPGKVFKGKKMAGRLGHESATVQSQIVVKIDVDRGLLYIKGQVPGAIDTLVKIRDACKKIEAQYLNLEYPTWVPPKNPEELKKLPRQLVWEGTTVDPFEDYIHENDVVSGKDQEED